VVDERDDHAVDGFAESLDAGEVCEIDARRPVEDAGLDDPVGEVQFGPELFLIDSAACGDGGQEVQSWSVGDKLELRITTLTGDGHYRNTAVTG